MDYHQVKYEQYVESGITPGTFCYELMSVKFVDNEFGQLIIGLRSENIRKRVTYDDRILPLLILNPTKYSWKGSYMPNNFYNCTVHGNQKLCFYADGIIFIIDDKWYDLANIKPLGKIGEIVYIKPHT